jgi:hypothetical protein
MDEPYVIVFLARICDSGSCREFEAIIFWAYPLLGVFIISPKFRLKAPSSLGDPLIEILGRIRRQFSGLSRVIWSLVPGDPEGIG